MKNITTEELRGLQDRKGLILQGCGGDLQEWVDGINGILEQEGILPQGTRLQDVAAFQNGEITNLLFLFGEEKVDMGKLAVWRIKTHSQFEGTWLSDYVHNYLGGFRKEYETKRPDCPLIGEDGNIFHLMALASRTLREHGMNEQAEKMQKRITGGECHSYEEALQVLGEYVVITSKEAGQGMSMEDGEGQELSM